jgi:hypothetical protein
VELCVVIFGHTFRSVSNALIFFPRGSNFISAEALTRGRGAENAEEEREKDERKIFLSANSASLLFLCADEISKLQKEQLESIVSFD